ncbi:hypothetical protein [Cryobacterium zhongshanensis]|uniref:Uncharacterized protein n=1 Tax=Cryobacterium zhongshanensis TaxID=2928153 RepID=A0AA41QX45_9MICO|nr:hypothetical protein [Cryobacterium zhongshanensis]MCI4659755.1 hypothetical protein [Cryobacterium zhongshanensis]
MANTQNLVGIRCPMCFETGGFVIQKTMNVTMQDDGYDSMGGRFPNDQFPGRVIAEEDGFQDDDPIMCANRNGCEHRGTVHEFLEITQDTTREYKHEGARR